MLNNFGQRLIIPVAFQQTLNFIEQAVHSECVHPGHISVAV